MAIAPVRRAALATAILLTLATPAAHAVGSGQAEAIARRYLQDDASRLGLAATDLRELSVSSNVPGSAPGLRHVYLQQNFRGIPVWHALATVSVTGPGAVFHPGVRFQRGLAQRAGQQAARRNPVQAVRAAAAFLELPLPQPVRALSNVPGPRQRTVLSDGGLARGPISAELVWYPADDIGQLRLSWHVAFEEGRHAWSVFVDAGTGEPLGAKDRVLHEGPESIAGSAMASVLAGAALVAAEPVGPPAFAPLDASEYTVYPFPFESPADGGRRAVTGAASPLASPYGWHDTNGAAGGESTRTRGNNVIAYTDTDANNNIDVNSEAEGGAGLKFAFPMQAGQPVTSYTAAAVTNLFYWTNVVHDIVYGYGFTEAAGNFQNNNYGKGGLGSDDLRAEDQDGSGSDNANFSTPVDGSNPRMQMFGWNFPLPNQLLVSAPGSIAGNYNLTSAGFGPAFSAGAKSGALVLANDGTGTASDGCEALTGFPAGAIAVIDRGTCTFVVKVKNAQLAGAIAVVVVNNVAGDAISLGGTDATIAIPSGMLTLADGTRIRAALPGTATAQAYANPPPARPSSLDAGVVVHEYGHGISTRLTGGPSNSSCLDNAEQMGEGWSDFYASALTARASDVGSTRRGMATWLIWQPPTGNGIRNTPYSTSMATNPATYASVANTTSISSPHGIGYVWNSMLWEVYWNLVRRHGFNPNLYQGWQTGGNNLALQLVTDGLKLQPCGPGFVDGRDAILAADTALTGGANQCEIWRGFAKRGLGASATQGNSNDRSDGVEAYDLPNQCKLAVFGGFQGLQAAPAINAIAEGQAVNLQFSVTGVAGPVAIDTQPVDCNTLEASSERPSPLSSPTGLQQAGSNYTLDWRPSRGFSGTCRAVTVRIPAASDAVAYFRFGAPRRLRPN